MPQLGESRRALQTISDEGDGQGVDDVDEDKVAACDGDVLRLGSGVRPKWCTLR